MNKRVTSIKETVLSENWYLLKRIDFKYQNAHGEWEDVSREVYNRGNGVAILLYNTTKQTVILTRQFRMPTYVNGNEDGMMIEVPAGIIEGENPKASILRETDEETGFQIKNATKVMETYVSPGAVTEKLTLFVAEYEDHMRAHKGGGLDSEQEDIEVFERSFKEAEEMVSTGQIQDAKTILLIQYARIHGLLT